MANVVFKKGLLASLPATKAEGTFYVTTDERALYLDVDGSTRVRIGDFQEFATLAALQANSNPSTTALYYVTELNVLAKWNGSAYTQINLNTDTGATSVEVVGDGNAVTAASYDEATRKLTLTMGATYATPGDVDTKIAAKVGEVGDKTVKAYVDEKTAGIASDAALKELGDRVTTLEGDKTVDGSVDKKIDDAIKALDVEAVTAGTGEVISEVSETDGVVSVKKKTLAADDIPTLTTAKLSDFASEMAKKQDVVAFEGTYNKETNKAATMSDVTGAIGDLDVTDTAVAGQYVSAVSETDGKIAVTRAALPVYTIERAATAEDGFAATYKLMKDNVQQGASINIIKDNFVDTVELADANAEGTAGKYIKITFKDTSKTTIYLDVTELFNPISSGSGDNDIVKITVAENGAISASVTDGSITADKLHADVQAKLNKAHEHSNPTVLDGITAEKVAAWDAAEANVQADWSVTDTASDAYIANKPTLGKLAAKDSIKNADVADDAAIDQSKIAGLTEALAGKADNDDLHTHANKEELDKIAAGDKAKWDAAEQNAIAAVKGASGDAASAETVYGAKAYADAAVQAAMTWGSF